MDAPGIVRKPLLFKRMAITQFKLDIGKCPKKKDLLAALEPAAAKFAASPWGKKLAAKTLKANQTVSSKVALLKTLPLSLSTFLLLIPISLFRTRSHRLTLLLVFFLSSLLFSQDFDRFKKMVAKGKK